MEAHERDRRIVTLSVLRSDCELSRPTGRPEFDQIHPGKIQMALILPLSYVVQLTLSETAEANDHGIGNEDWV